MATTGRSALDHVITAGGVIGAVTGVGTIVGWIVSADLGATLDKVLPIAGGVFLGVVLVMAIVDMFTPDPDWSTDLWLVGIWGTIGAWSLAQGEGLETPLRFGGWIAVATGVLLAAAFTAGVVIPQRQRARETAAVRTCPDCAEDVKAAARVCRYCGYRFSDPPPAHSSN